MSTVKDKIKAARLPETTVPLCLRGDLRSRFEELERRLGDLVAKPDPEMLNDPLVVERRRVAEEIRQLEAQMAEETLTVTVRGMPQPAWAELLAAHPARNGIKADEPLDINVETFWPALLRACTVAPELDDEDWDNLIGDASRSIEGVLTDRQFQDWTMACWRINRGEVDVPFSRIASAVLRPSASE